MNVPDVLLAMEMSSKPTDAPQNSSSPDSSATSPDSKTNDTKRKVSSVLSISTRLPVLCWSSDFFYFIASHIII